MTTYDNGFDLGSGSPVTTARIASSGYGFHVGGSGAATFTTTDAIDGAQAIELVRASNTLQVYTNNALSTTDISWSFMFNYKGSIPNGNDYLWDVVCGGTSVVRCLTNSSGNPFIQLSGATIGTAAGAFVAGTQYRCDFRVHISGTVGTITCDFYPVYGATPSFTGFAFTGKNTGTVAIADVFVGPYGANSVTVGTFVLDRVRGDDSQSTSYLGAPSSGHAGSASLVSTATLGVVGFVSHAAAAALVSTATLGASPTGIGVTYNDARFTYGSFAVTYAGVIAAPTVALLAPATLGAINIDTHFEPTVPGQFTLTVSTPTTYELSVAAGGSP